MDRIDDSFDTASGQEGRLRPAALNTSLNSRESSRTINPLGWISPTYAKERTPCLIDSNN